MKMQKSENLKVARKFKQEKRERQDSGKKISGRADKVVQQKEDDELV